MESDKRSHVLLLFINKRIGFFARNFCSTDSIDSFLRSALFPRRVEITVSEFTAYMLNVILSGQMKTAKIISITRRMNRKNGNVGHNRFVHCQPKTQQKKNRIIDTSNKTSTK